MLARWVFEWEVTDRRRWPSNWGRAVVLAPNYIAAFQIAHDMVALSTKAAMVTRLDCVTWPE